MRKKELGGLGGRSDVLRSAFFVLISNSILYLGKKTAFLSRSSGILCEVRRLLDAEREEREREVGMLVDATLLRGLR